MAYAIDAFPKTCGKCGEVYLEDDWTKLEYVGVQRGKDIGFVDLELRNCPCKSTIAVQLV